MIKKFLCWFLGHKFIMRSFVSKTPINDYEYCTRYEYKVFHFCHRCGKKNEDIT